MSQTFFKNKYPKSDYLMTLRRSEDNCKVSKASREIMLNRFYNGNRIEFPFAP